MNDRLGQATSEQLVGRWLSSFAPSGRCKLCGGELVEGRAFTCESCDERARTKEAEAAAVLVQPGRLTILDLSEVSPPAMLRGKAAIDDPGFPPADEWSRETQLALSAWQPDHAGQWVYGTVGSGKSTLLAGLALRLQRDGVQACLTSAKHLRNGLRGLVRSDRDRYNELVQGLAAVPVLLIDDLLLEAPSDWEKRVLYEVLDGRMEAGLPLIATSNVPLERARAVLQGDEPDGSDAATMAQRIVGRLRACTGGESLCLYPGDRRTGEFDEGVAASWRGLLR